MTLGEPASTTVHHITDQRVQKEGLRGQIRETDRVVIPAKHEGATIATTVGYLLGMGFQPNQIIILVNGPSEIDGKPDDTADVARAVSADLRVYHQSDLLAQVMVDDKPLVGHLQSEYQIDPSRLHGKGTAMFCAILALVDDHLPDDARVIFLDADIKNPSEVDPVGRLLIGADQFPTTVRMVKLASLGRDNAGITAFLSTLTSSHAMIGALRWPLCGQVIVYWGDLKQMRFASGYAVEMAMMMDLTARAGTPSVFGEVEIGAALLDKKNSDRVHVRMYAAIMDFAGWVHFNSRGLPHLNREQIRTLNGRGPMHVWTPVKAQGDGPNVLESRYRDVLLPSIADLFG